MNSIDSFKVMTGKFQRNYSAIESLPTQTFGLTHIIKPELYRGAYGYYRHDIALLVLNGFIEFWPHTAPICLELNLQENEKILKAGTQGKVAGWGLTHYNQPSEVLRSITVPVVSLEQCKREADELYQPYINDDKLCTGSKDGAGVCKGYAYEI